MPGVEGLVLVDAKRKLQQAGVSDPQIVEKFDGSKQDGVVLSQRPSAGSTIRGDAVQIEVNARPRTMYLADTDAVGADSPKSGVESISGTTYAHSVSSSSYLYGDSKKSYEFDLGRHYDTLTAMAGVTDKSGSASRVLLEVYGNGRKLFSKEVSLGHPVSVQVGITGVLRLELRATNLNSQYDASISAYPAWGDARVEVAGTPATPTPAPTTISTP